MRGTDELINVDEPAWPELQELFAAGTVPVKVLPVDRDESRRCLLQTQVTARSVLGAVVLNSGGLVLDDGWVRVFGGGSGENEDSLPSLAQVNAFPADFDPAWHPATGLVVGHDVLGGVFALNGHDPEAAGRPGVPGQMTYFAPDTLEWEAMEMGHSVWISWMLSGRLEKFYEGLRWPGWREEVATLSFSQGISVIPFLWSQEAQADIAATHRRAVPMREVLGIAADFAQKMGLVHPDSLVRCHDQVEYWRRLGNRSWRTSSRSSAGRAKRTGSKRSTACWTNSCPSAIPCWPSGAGRSWTRLPRTRW